jgi:hypothetical protein
MKQRMKNTSERPNDGRNTFLYKGILSHEVKGEKEKTGGERLGPNKAKFDGGCVFRMAECIVSSRVLPWVTNPA